MYLIIGLYLFFTLMAVWFALSICAVAGQADKDMGLK